MGGGLREHPRSFLLRRRLRRHMEEMIAAGVMMPGALDDLPGGMGRQRRRDFGEKPKLWEVWVDEQGQIHEGSESDFGGKEESKWEDILVGVYYYFCSQSLLRV